MCLLELYIINYECTSIISRQIKWCRCRYKRYHLIFPVIAILHSMHDMSTRVEWYGSWFKSDKLIEYDEGIKLNWMESTTFLVFVTKKHFFPYSFAGSLRGYSIYARTDTCFHGLDLREFANTSPIDSGASQNLPPARNRDPLIRSVEKLYGNCYYLPIDK